MFKIRKSLVAALCLLPLPLPLLAQEAVIRKNLEALTGPNAIESVTKVPYGNLYEVLLKSGDIAYSDDKGTYFVAGALIDVKNKKNITQARLAQLSKINFADLPLDQAIKQVKGNGGGGKRVIASFEDPNCGYCKKLAAELKGMKDVTIYTFLVPVVSPDSIDKSKDIWCASDRVKAWNDWMLEAKAPADAKCDASAIDKNTNLGHKLKITGTPTIFLADGTRLSGYASLDELEKAMAEVGAKKK